MELKEAVKTLKSWAHARERTHKSGLYLENRDGTETHCEYPEESDILYQALKTVIPILEAWMPE